MSNFTPKNNPSPPLTNSNFKPNIKITWEVNRRQIGMKGKVVLWVSKLNTSIIKEWNSINLEKLLFFRKVKTTMTNTKMICYSMYPLWRVQMIQRAWKVCRLLINYSKTRIIGIHFLKCIGRWMRSRGICQRFRRNNLIWSNKKTLLFPKYCVS